MTQGERIKRVDELIKDEVSKIILKEIDFPPNVVVTPTRAKTNSAITQSKVFISVYPEKKQKEVLKILNEKIWHIQKILDKKLKMRFVPKIVFVPELETIKAGRIEAILEKLKKEKK